MSGQVFLLLLGACGTRNRAEAPVADAGELEQDGAFSRRAFCLPVRH
jgi:hypothetical protein